MAENTSESRTDLIDIYERMLSAADSSDQNPDVGIDLSLVMYSGLNSAAKLEKSVSMCSKIPGYAADLVTALAAFETVPNAVGLVAVVVSIGLELIIAARDKNRESKDGTQYMMQRVFAEEKASGVRDSMDEYMKRLRMNLYEPTRALEETERLEKQLSEQLTHLKNSMLHDKQMSSRSLKHWTNGAAFHLQMLIHAARLKTQSSSGHQKELQVHVASIKSVIDLYQFDLEELLKQYKAYKKSTISLSKVYDFNASQGYYVVKDKELEREIVRVDYSGKAASILSDDYVDYMFDNWSKLKELKSYFSDLKKNLKDLIIEKGEFNLQRALPVSGNQSA